MAAADVLDERVPGGDYLYAAAPSTCWDCLEHMSMVGSVGRIFGVVG
jgi:hypothetical protein